MPNFVYALCSCGRTLRATPEQGGTSVRCWNCHQEVPLPHADPVGRMLLEMRVAGTSLIIHPAPIMWSVALTLVLLIPVAGPALFVCGIAAAFALVYGDLVRKNHPSDPPTGLVLRFGRWFLAGATALAMVAPFLIRNGGYVLPTTVPNPNAARLMLLACSGWILMPLLLLAAHARGPSRTLTALARHPRATLAALLIVPLGLIAVEFLAAGIAWGRGHLPLLVGDMFPTPRLELRGIMSWMVFNIDGKIVEARCAYEMSSLLPVYPLGLSRGFTLIGTIPGSLWMGSTLRQPLWIFGTPGWEYLGLRIVLTIAILWASAIILTTQARWFFAIANAGGCVAPAVPKPGHAETSARGLDETRTR